MSKASADGVGAATVIEEYRRRVASGDLSADPAQEHAAEILSERAAALSEWSRGLSARIAGKSGPGARGVYLHGDVGRGKSMLMDMFFDTVATSSKRRAHFHEFMLDIHARAAELRSRGEDEPVAKIARDIAKENWLLCFDELHVTDIADAMILGRLFEGLFERGVVLVATSNRMPRELYQNGLNRQLFLPFIELMEKRMDVVELNAAKDYRLAKLAEATVWLTPLDPETAAALDAIWERVKSGEPEHAENISVKGRKVPAPRTAGGAARFSFEELCARPLGAQDYLALVRRFHTFIIDDIPRLGPERRNEAKRFVTLVDVLYQTRAKLIASAQAEPDALYPEGDGSFEFSRTASRLYEMRSRDYLAAARQAA